MEGTRRQLCAVIQDAIEIGSSRREMKETGQTSLFDMGEGESSDEASLNAIALPNLADWTEREKLDMEKELVGFFLSGHPLDRFRADIRSFSSATSSSVGELQDGKNVEMVGMLTNIKQFTDKKGDPMAFVTLEDMEGNFEALVFASVYKEVQTILFVGSVIYLKGRISKRPTDESGKVLANEIVRIEDVRSRRARLLEITLPADQVTMEHLEKIRTIMREYNGRLPVRLRVPCGAEGDVFVMANARFKIHPSDEFLADFEKLDLPGSMRFIGE